MAKLVQVKHMVTIMHTADMSATPDVVIAGLLALPKGDESCILPPTHSFAEYGAGLLSRRLLDAFLATAHDMRSRRMAVEQCANTSAGGRQTQCRPQVSHVDRRHAGCWKGSLVSQPAALLLQYS